ncbi:MAG: hypothetical protein GY772_22550, partial [bacterium]|nr:hypothetical protein [bacterium]
MREKQDAYLRRPETLLVGRRKIQHHVLHPEFCHEIPQASLTCRHCGKTVPRKKLAIYRTWLCAKRAPWRRVVTDTLWKRTLVLVRFLAKRKDFPTHSFRSDSTFTTCTACGKYSRRHNRAAMLYKPCSAKIRQPNLRSLFQRRCTQALTMINVMKGDFTQRYARLRAEVGQQHLWPSQMLSTDSRHRARGSVHDPFALGDELACRNCRAKGSWAQAYAFYRSSCGVTGRERHLWRNRSFAQLRAKVEAAYTRLNIPRHQVDDWDSPAEACRRCGRSAKSRRQLLISPCLADLPRTKTRQLRLRAYAKALDLGICEGYVKAQLLQLGALKPGGGDHHLVLDVCTINITSLGSRWVNLQHLSAHITAVQETKRSLRGQQLSEADLKLIGWRPLWGNPGPSGTPRGAKRASAAAPSKGVALLVRDH